MPLKNSVLMPDLRLEPNLNKHRDYFFMEGHPLLLLRLPIGKDLATLKVSLVNLYTTLNC